MYVGVVGWCAVGVMWWDVFVAWCGVVLMWCDVVVA